MCHELSEHRARKVAGENVIEISFQRRIPCSLIKQTPLLSKLGWVTFVVTLTACKSLKWEEKYTSIMSSVLSFPHFSWCASEVLLWNKLLKEERGATACSSGNEQK